MSTTTPKLKIIDVSATIGCNLSCKGCNHFSNYFAPGSKLDTDQLIKDIHTILPRVDVDRVSVIGGEPLLNPRVREIVHACLEHQDVVYLYTNGLLLNEENRAWIDEDLNEYPGLFLRVSIHVPEVFENIQKMKSDKVIITEHHDGKDRWFNSIKQSGGKVYPYGHNKIESSFHFCSCPNTQLYKGKLWKCPNSAFLEELLYVTEQQDDDCWVPYKSDGLPVDCSDEELAEFCYNSKKAEEICNMCTARPLRFSGALQVNHKKKIVS